MKTINREIVSALIFSKDGKLLMGMKDPSSGGVYANCWHIPGGGVDDNESQLEALKREIIEEVGIDIATAQVRLADDQGSGETEKTLKDTGEIVRCKMKFSVYEVKLATGSKETLLSPTDDLIKLEWVGIKQLPNYMLTPPSVSLFKRLGYLVN